MILRICAIFLSFWLSLAFAAPALTQQNNEIEDNAVKLLKTGHFSEAQALLEPHANKGSASAQNLMGELFRLQDKPELAVQWYTKSAEQGYAPGQNNLAMCYIEGKGAVKQNEAEGFKWLLKAAEQGHAKAQNNLSVLYATGRGVPKNDSESAKWCKKAAEQGDLSAITNMARKYASGMGVEKSPEESLKWYTKAAEADDPKAQYLLGNLYETGTNVSKDLNTARHWYKAAANQSFAPAADSLIAMEPPSRLEALGVIMIHPGERLLVLFDSANGFLSKAHINRLKNPQTPSDKQLEISCTYDAQKNVTLLNIQNGFEKSIEYECSINVDGSLGYERTTVVPVIPKKFGMELWPYKINKIMILALRQTD